MTATKTASTAKISKASKLTIENLAREAGRLEAQKFYGWRGRPLNVESDYWHVEDAALASEYRETKEIRKSVSAQFAIQHKEALDAHNKSVAHIQVYDLSHVGIGWNYKMKREDLCNQENALLKAIYEIYKEAFSEAAYGHLIGQ